VRLSFKRLSNHDLGGGVARDNTTVIFAEQIGGSSMDDSTKTGGTVVQLYTSASAGKNSPRQLQGTLLTFVDKQFLAGTGQHRTDIPFGTRFVVVSINGKKLFGGNADAQVIGQLDEVIGEMARDNGVTPEEIARDGMHAFLKRGGFVPSPDEFWRPLMLMWVLLSKPTDRPVPRGRYRDYVEAWDFNFDIRSYYDEKTEYPTRVWVMIDGRMRGESRWMSLT
jgi:hypothetical protein